MANHASLTGAELHEPKGVASASVNTTYVADGSGSGAWQKIGSSSINTGSILNLNKGAFTYTFTDIGTAASKYIGIPFGCTINKITVCVQSSPTTSPTVLTFRNDAGTSMGTITILAAAIPGAIGTLSPSSNNSFTTDTKFQIDTDGGAANNPDAVISVTYTLV